MIPPGTVCVLPRSMTEKWGSAYVCDMYMHMCVKLTQSMTEKWGSAYVCDMHMHMCVTLTQSMTEKWGSAYVYHTVTVAVMVTDDLLRYTSFRKTCRLSPTVKSDIV